MDHIDLSRYFVEKGYKTGRPRCDAQKLLKVILFAFMENGICSLREIEKLCRNDIRYMYLLDGMKTPSFATFGNLIRNELTDSIEQIFEDINSYIFAKDHVDLQHTYIDGTKIEANANRYTWVWKKSCVKNRQKVFDKISLLIDAMNREVLGYLGIKFEKREAYAVDYVSELLTMYKETTGLDETSFVSGRGHRKSIQQKQYEELHEYLERLKSYAYHIETCGEERNSYSKTDHGATFMRLKRDYMGNDQLLPAYNLQAAICDEYIAVIDVKPYASDMECFVPLMEKFNRTYGHYPKYPVADAGYQELTAIHQEVLQNLESIHGALLRMNRSIQSEGTFGVLKWDKAYKRLLRRGEKNVILELTLISCGFNLYKYHNKKSNDRRKLHKT